MFTPKEIEALHDLLEKTCEKIHYMDSKEKPYDALTLERLNRRFEALHEFNESCIKHRN